MSQKVRGFWVFGALVGLLMLGMGAKPALADSVTYVMTGGNAGLTSCAGCTGPYANVTVTLTSSTTATVTITSLDSNGYTYLLGEVGLNVNAASFTGAFVSASNSLPVSAGFTVGTDSFNGSKTMDGFGTFNATFAGTVDQFSNTATTITVTLTNTGGTWASAGDVLTTGAGVYPAAVHSYACLDPCTVAEGAASTGFATVPEPASIALLGTGMLAIAGALRRRKNQTVVAD